MMLWNEPTLRQRASDAWDPEAFEDLLLLDQSDLIETHFRASKHGRLTRAGVDKQHFLDSIWLEYRANLEARIDPIYTAARWVKHVVMHRPFYDANRRTGFAWAADHLGFWGIDLVINTPDAVAYKHTVRNRPFREVYAWFAERARV